MNLLSFIGSPQRLVEKVPHGNEAPGPGQAGYPIGRRVGRGGGPTFFEAGHGFTFGPIVFFVRGIWGAGLVSFVGQLLFGPSVMGPAWGGGGGASPPRH